MDIVDTFDKRVLGQLAFSLDGVHNLPTFETAQGMASALASSLIDRGRNFIIDLADTQDFLKYDPSTGELTYHVEFTESFAKGDDLALGFDLDQGLADLKFNAPAGVDAGLALDLTFGMDLKKVFAGANPLDWFFIKTPPSRFLAVTANQLDATARFGFLGIEVVDGSISADADIKIALADPGTTANDGRIDLRELVDGLSDPASLIDATLTGSANLALPISVPFLGLTPGADTTLTIDWSDLKDPNTISLTLPAKLSELPNFTNMDAGTFVGLLGQISNWLDEFRHSDTFSAADVPLIGKALDDALAFADVISDTLLFDDLDDDDATTGVAKLLDANNVPTYTTTQELAAKLAQILGVPSNLFVYDAAADTLTFTLDLSQSFPALDLPIDFNFNLAPLLDVGSDSTIRFASNGGLTLKLGLYLGNEGGIELTNATSLASLNNGIEINRDLSIAGQNEVKTVFGRLDGDATVKLALNGGAEQTVTVAKSDTDGNNAIDDLVADLNTAINAVAVLTGKVVASREGQRVVLSASGATAFTLTAANGTPAVTQIGFRSNQSGENEGGALKIRGAADVSGFVGRLSADTVLNVSMNGVNGGAPVAVTVKAIDAASNRNILDAVADVQRALNNAGFSGKITVGSSGKRLVLTASAPGTTTFSITAAGTAASELGFGASSQGGAADLIITTRDNGKHQVTLDGAVTLGDVIQKIKQQTGNKVDVQFADGNTRLRLIDTTSGSAVFKVENAFGSNAAFDLGVLGLDTTDPTTDPADGQFDSAALGGVNVLDRLFVQDATVHAGFSLSTPGGISGGAKFGFVGIGVAGGGALTGSLSIALKDPGTSPNSAGRITLKELIDNIGNLGSLIQTPQLQGSGLFTLGVSLDPAFPAIGTSTPTLTIAVNNLGNPFASTPTAPDVDITTAGFEDLANFDKLGFQDIIVALQALADFLGQFEQFGFLNEKIPLLDVSIHDLLSFGDEFSAALDQVRNNPAATIQFLESKLKEAFNLPADSTLLKLALVDDGTDHILRVDLDFAPTFSESLPIRLQLPGPSGLVDLSGNAGLSAQGSLDLQLAFGIDLTDPTKVWIFGDTGIQGNLSAAATGIDFTADLGGFGAHIRAGNAQISGSFDLGLEDAALTGSISKRRALLSDLLANFGSAVDASLTGTITSTLPVFFPSESAFRGNIQVGGALSADTAGGLAVNGTLAGNQFVVVPADLFAVDFTKLSPLANLELLIDGIDTLPARTAGSPRRRGVRHHAAAGRATSWRGPRSSSRISAKASSLDFREAIETSATPDQNFISLKLLELLGPSGLNLLRDRDGNGSVNIGDIQLTTNVDQNGVDPRDVFMQWDLRLGAQLRRRRRRHRLRSGHSGPGAGDARRRGRERRLAARLRFRRRLEAGLLPGHRRPE